jgi:WD40 repeat protein
LCLSSYSFDCKLILTASFDDGTIKIYEILNNYILKQTIVDKESTKINSARFSSDSKLIVSCGASCSSMYFIKIWETETGKLK